uniref:Transposase (Putative), gypsy type n=1 Tax=Tanacetum cinerariifolium TaxID=118510 RepID=A0A699H791_TANCI|nr:hypothetical protein [Tanacetum cinerariifolium]
MDLFAFIHHSNPTKVRIGERELAEREVGLLKMTKGRTVPLSPPATMTPEDSGDSGDKLFDDADQEHVVKKSDDVLEETIAKDASKFVAEKARKKRKRKVVGDASGSTYPPKELRDDHQSLLPNTGRKSLVTLRVSVAVTITVDVDDAAGSKAKDMSKDFENIGDFTSAGGVNADTTSISRLKKTSTSSDSFLASQSLDTETMHHRLAPPVLFAQLRAIDYDQLYSEFNIGAARPVCLGVKVRMRAEHTLERKGKLEDKCPTIRNENCEDAAKSTELRDLKEQNFALEGERSALSKRVITLESVTISKEAELASLSSQVTKLTADLSGFQLLRDELNSKVASLESERDCLAAQKSSLKSAFNLFRERIEALQDEQAKALGDRALGRAIGCAVNKGIKDGLKAGINHGKVRRNLSVVEAYDPFVEEKYVDSVNALGVVDFSLLFELEFKKDSSIVDLMDSLCLEGALVESPKAKDLQPSPKQLMLPIHKLKDNVVFAETFCLLLSRSLTCGCKGLTGEAISFAAPMTTLSTTFASSVVIPPSLVVSDQILDVEPYSEDPPALTFEKEKLSTSPE